MKALFILARDATYRAHGAFTRSISYAPLSLPVLAALTPPGWNVTLVDEGVQPPLTEGSFDVVGVSCVAASAPRAYELAAFWKRRGAHTILGGIHPTLMPDEAARHADTIVVGFAEHCLSRFWDDHAAGHPQARYEDDLGPRDGPGGGDRVVLHTPRPRRDLLAKRYMSAVGVIANHGCPHRCTFCAIGARCRHRSLPRPVADVVDELASLKTRRVVMLDPSFTADREYALELLAAMAPLRLRWGGLATLDVADDPPLLDALARAGCIGLLVGFESVTPASLARAAKTTNAVPGFKTAVSCLHEHGIRVLGTFVAGFDDDTPDSLDQTLAVIDEIGVDLPRFGILTPFPGTPLHRTLRAQGRILTDDLRLYDETHAVFAPARMSASALESAYLRWWREAYTYRRIRARARDPLSWSLNLAFRWHGRALARLVAQSRTNRARSGHHRYEETTC